MPRPKNTVTEARSSASRSNGRKGGAPRTIKRARWRKHSKEINAMLAKGRSIREIATHLGVSPNAVYKWRITE